jgi:hypothetical protein
MFFLFPTNSRDGVYELAAIPDSCPTDKEAKDLIKDAGTIPDPCRLFWRTYGCSVIELSTFELPAPCSAACRHMPGYWFELEANYAESFETEL